MTLLDKKGYRIYILPEDCVCNYPEDRNATCNAENNGWRCNRYPDHEGQHVACDSYRGSGSSSNHQRHRWDEED